MSRPPKSLLSSLGAKPSSELVDLGEKVRAVVDAMLRIDDATGALAEASEELEAVARRLAVHARADELRLGRDGEAPDARPYFVDGVMLPPYHPLAAEHEIHTEEGVTRGSVTFGVVFEGPPGCVHGGHVASFFDQILGYHTLELGLPAMTASLTLHYRRPTPLFTRLNFGVRIREVDGRKIRVTGELRSEEQTYVDAEGLFVLPSNATSDVLRGVVRAGRAAAGTESS